MNLQKQANMTVVLANAGALVSGIIKNISGNDISDSLNNSKISSSVIDTLTYQRIVKNISNKFKNY